MKRETPLHRADPVWYDARSNIICKVCRKKLIGNGTSRHPWRHPGEPAIIGVVA